MAQPSPKPDAAAVLADALTLPPVERLRLADALLESVGPPPGVLVEGEPGALEELDRRAEEHLREPSRARPWGEVRAELYARLGRR
jgi:putative addiction module component (TIGR02574 family)